MCVGCICHTNVKNLYDDDGNEFVWKVIFSLMTCSTPDALGVSASYNPIDSSTRWRTHIDLYGCTYLQSA